MPHTISIRAGATLLLMLTVVNWVAGLHAQEVPGFLTPTLMQANESTGPRPLAPGQQGVIVLTDGRVFSGRITETGGGYRIDFDNTFVVIPFEQTRVTSATLGDAYIVIRDGLKSPLAVDHLKLAEWCQANNLITEARIEAATALKLEPLRRDARALLWQIDQKMNAQAQATAGGDAVQADSVTTTTPVAAEVLAGGMSKETQQTFIRQVQPLLFNKCGNVHCHGSEAQNSFMLSGNRSSSTNDRLGSEANLEAVMRQINTQSPASSPLLTKPSELLGSHRKVFQGGAGGTQRQLLVNWVTQVASEQAQSNPQRPPTRLPKALDAAELPGMSPTGSTATIGTEPGRLSPPVTAGPLTARPGFSGSGSATLSNTELRAILDQQQPDAFDPEVFNRLVHGASSSELKSGSSAQP